MITLYRLQEGLFVPDSHASLTSPLENALWIDCFRPTRQEELALEAAIGAGLPTREEMQEIEPSSRLSTEDGVLYLTAVILCRSESVTPQTTAVSFVMTDERLITVRYDEPGMMPIAIGRITKPNAGANRPAGVLITMLEAAIDRLADVVERASERIDSIARHVFDMPIQAADSARLDHNIILRSVGREGMRLGLMGESLISLSRLLLFLFEKAEPPRFNRDDKVRVKTMVKDVEALRDHVHRLEDRVTFLLDATLGLISIQQNGTIKIFSILAVIFLPPTLIASIYGMNFHIMPELQWEMGYPFALLLMVLSVALTFALFRWRRWL